MELYIKSAYLSTSYDFDVIKEVMKKWVEEVEKACANCQEFDCYGCKYADLRKEEQ